MWSNLRGNMVKPSWKNGHVGQIFVVLRSNLRGFMVKFLSKLRGFMVNFLSKLRGFMGKTSGIYGQNPEFQVCSGIWFEGGVGLIRVIL